MIYYLKEKHCSVQLKIVTELTSHVENKVNMTTYMCLNNCNTCKQVVDVR